MSCSGRPSPELLEIVRLLLAKEHLYSSLTQKHHLKVKFSELNSKEKSFLQRYVYMYIKSTLLMYYFLRSLVEHCLRAFPESSEQVLSTARLHTAMTTKERYAFTLAKGQQNCLEALSTRLQRGTREC